MNVTIFGAGKVGRGLARRLRATPHRVRARSARSGLPRGVITDACLVLAVRDGDLGELAARLASGRKVSKRTAVVHVAGALSPEVLAPLRPMCAGVGQMHPMISFASPKLVPDLERGYVLVSGDTVAARRAMTLARAMRMTPRRVQSLDRAAYHAAGGLVANGAAALAACGAVLLERAGLPARDAPRVLGPLLGSVARNVEELGLPDALTGPIRRGDARAVRAHFDRIAEVAPELGEIYLACAAAQLPLARAIGDAPGEDLEAVAETLKWARSRPAAEPRRPRKRRRSRGRSPKVP